MFRDTHRLHTRVATSIAVVALAVPAASAATPNIDDPRSSSATAGQGSVDLRSPDAKDAQSYVDVRSPDAKDTGGAAKSASTPVIAQQGSGFEWGDAAIGAGSVLGLLLITLSLAFGVVHRRGHGPKGPAVTT